MNSLQTYKGNSEKRQSHAPVLPSVERSVSATSEITGLPFRNNHSPSIRSYSIAVILRVLIRWSVAWGENVDSRSILKAKTDAESGKEARN